MNQFTDTFLFSYLIAELNKPFVLSEAYKLGIIDEQGEQLKRPVTLEEKGAYTPLTAYIFKLKRQLGSKLGILNSATYLEEASKNSKLPIELYDTEVDIKYQMSWVAEQFGDIVKKAKAKGLPDQTIEKIIMESFINK